MSKRRGRSKRRKIRARAVAAMQEILWSICRDMLRREIETPSVLTQMLAREGIALGSGGRVYFSAVEDPDHYDGLRSVD